ncbi:hypothetical protein B0H12DRAFT_280792 [Mycena haematopus]|nr:hypothetical protein B0H12DRAFT_280792 [Mycena haematopus]
MEDAMEDEGASAEAILTDLELIEHAQDLRGGPGNSAHGLESGNEAGVLDNLHNPTRGGVRPLRILHHGYLPSPRAGPLFTCPRRSTLPSHPIACGHQNLVVLREPTASQAEAAASFARIQASFPLRVSCAVSPGVAEGDDEDAWLGRGADGLTRKDGKRVRCGEEDGEETADVSPPAGDWTWNGEAEASNRVVSWRIGSVDRSPACLPLLIFPASNLHRLFRLGPFSAAASQSASADSRLARSRCRLVESRYPLSTLPRALLPHRSCCPHFQIRLSSQDGSVYSIFTSRAIAFQNLHLPVSLR